MLIVTFGAVMAVILIAVAVAAIKDGQMARDARNSKPE
jgi:hypothetical protein